MKKTITLLAMLYCTVSLFAQNVTYDLRWDSDNSLYELYVTRDLTAVAPVTTGGTAAVTIVFPTDGVEGTRTLSHTSESVSSFNPAGVIRSPAAASTNDFYVFNSTGGSSYIGVLNADVEVLWMTFRPSDGNSEARLFENGTDPSSTDSGMMGINARSEFFTITIAGAVNEFSANVVLGVASTELTELSMFPNPTAQHINFSSSKSVIKQITITDINGRQVTSLDSRDQLTVRMNISSLQTGVYIATIRTETGVENKRFIKK